MLITLPELIAGIEAKNGFALDQAQKDAIGYGQGPLLIAAGPGTGKTEVLVARCLKFICCDGVDPGSIILTTFTEKAATNLEDRLAEALLSLSQQYPQITAIDPSGLRIGTLHGLCNRILQEYRYTEYQNLRLLDEMETALLIHRLVERNVDGGVKADIENQFGYIFGRNPNRSKSRWDWSLALMTLFNRLIEDQVDLGRLQAAGGPWDALHQAYQIYDQELDGAYSCDFAHLLRHFLEFLGTGQGNTFLEGSGDVRPPLTHVLVDEYQDTNPIQESIYFRLCDALPHNITVVGDDDQALYRFRGGTVECMVGFSSLCQTRWNINPKVVYLSDNHRSDEDIVKWCNDYIGSFPQMALPNVRISHKPPLSSSLGRTGTHPAVGLIRKGTVGACAAEVANLTRDLLANGVIQDYSQCVLLLRSAQNSAHYAGPYQAALEAQNIPVYNPRSKDYLEQAEVAQCLGAFVRIIDPQLNHLQAVLGRSASLVQNWVDEYDALAPNSIELADYVSNGAGAVRAKGTGELITADTPTILYRILSHQPFVGYQANPERDLRLSKLTRLFEAFCAQYGRQLRTDDIVAGELPGWWYGNFYYGLCGYLAQERLNDDEDEDVVCPTGYFPIMTVHQAKGLEFEFVFVGNLGISVWDSSAHHLEQDLRPFRHNPPAVVHPIADAQWHDDIRQHFVAYSRAKFALVLVASNSQIRKGANETASFGGQGGGWVRQNALTL